MKKTILSALIVVTIVGCGTTKIVKTWMEPGSVVIHSAENKTLVIALVKDETSRRVIEDQLVTQFAKRFNEKAIVSYNLVTTDILKEASDETLKQKIHDGQFTHVLVMHMGDVEKETTYVPGTTTGYYGGYGRYYRYGAGLYSSPGYYTTDKNYFVETTVYTVNPDKLIWTGTTKTVNPDNIEKTINEIADVVSAKMEKDGFLK